ncbi:WxL protein peptidoglycan domain-containing protein [Catenuloplanes atrovinosus]|uniref:DUF916 domain-containing protein n=1 Tax=Catenuloplanes atrovinosus TaxID=137266 RepID=A0AAE3YRW5_9ACTN|nr:DUF916 domain-containing protein [Catenuloplanes atrovinosus]MDR7277540.1 hypothetical protein [Catenuloplanes atrovinosus]
MHRLVGLLITPLLATAPVPAPPAPSPSPITWSVAPSGPAGPDGRTALDYKLDPGATLTDHVVVTNHSRRTLTLRVYATDAFTTPEGGFDLLPADRAPAGAGAWLTPERETVVLPSASRVVVPVTVAVPANATPGDHVGGVVASLTGSATGPDGSAVAVDHRVGTRVHLRVTGALRPELSLRDARVERHVPWNPLRLPTLTATVTVANTGNVRLAGAASVRTPGSVFAGPGLPQVLPGGEVRATVRTGGVWPLFRVPVEIAVAPVAVDGQPLDPRPAPAVVRTAVWLVPWSQLAVLGALLLLTTAALLARRRRRRRLAAALAAAERRGRDLALSSPKESNP